MYLVARFLADSGWYARIFHSVASSMSDRPTQRLLKMTMAIPSLAHIPARRQLLHAPQCNSDWDPTYTVIEITDARLALHKEDGLHWINKETKSDTPTLFEALTRYRMFEATNAKDKVYAFLGFPALESKEGEQPVTVLVPDYAKSIRQIYLEASWHLIRTTGSLSILSAVQDKSLTQNSGLPSWVPDFSTRELAWLLGNAIFAPWSACGKRKFQSEQQTGFPTLPKVKGTTVDTIFASGRFTKEEELSAILHLLDHLRQYHTSDSLPGFHTALHVACPDHPIKHHEQHNGSVDAALSDEHDLDGQDFYLNNEELVPFVAEYNSQEESHQLQSSWHAFNVYCRLPLCSIQSPVQARIQTKAEVLWRTLVAD
jgi:hypothetical protein